MDTYMMRKLTIFSQTDKLASQPTRCKLRIEPAIMPKTVKMTKQAM